MNDEQIVVRLTRKEAASFCEADVKDAEGLWSGSLGWHDYRARARAKLRQALQVGKERVA